MTLCSDYKDETATEEDISSDLVNSLPLEMLHRGVAKRAAKVWVAIWSVTLHPAMFLDPSWSTFHRL